MDVDIRFLIAYKLIVLPLLRSTHFIIFGVAVALIVASLITNRKISRVLGLIGAFLMAVALVVIPVFLLVFITPFSAGVIELLKRMIVFAIICMPIVLIKIKKVSH